MRKHRLINRITCIIVVLLIVVTTIMTPIIANASEVGEGSNSSVIVTIGKDLNDEQKQLVLDYFNVGDIVEIVEVTNEDEHKYLDGIISSQKIGSKTYSCCCIQPTDSGGIHVKTVNLNTVSCDMIRNALVTSGIYNCNVVCVSPKEVSGTGALAGIFKVYEMNNGDNVDNTKIEIASEELVTTVEISDSIGEEDATNLMYDLKNIVIESGATDEDSISKIVNDYISENNLTLSEEQIDSIIKLLLEISNQEYDINEIKQSYSDLKNTIEDMKETIDMTKGLLDRIIDFFKMLIAKINGTYDELKEDEEIQMISEQLGIIANTNDSLLGDSTIVTTTEDSEIIEKISDNTNVDESTESKITFEEVNEEEQHNCEDNLEISNSVTDINGNTYGDGKCSICGNEYKTFNGRIATDEEIEAYNSTVLEYVTHDLQNGNNDASNDSESAPTLDELTNK